MFYITSKPSASTRGYGCTVCDRTMGILVEQDNEDYIDVIDEEANNVSSKVPTNSSSMFANLRHT